MNKDVKIVEELLGDKIKINREKWFLILLVGVLIFVIMLPVKDNDSYEKKQDAETRQEKISEQDMMQMELSNFLSKIKGVGKVETLIYTQKETENIYGKESDNTKITGVIIGAEGAMNETIRLQIINMVMALYDLEADAVEVYPLTRTFENK